MEAGESKEQSMNTFIYILGICVFLFAGCSQKDDTIDFTDIKIKNVEETTVEYKKIKGDEAATMMDGDTVVLDVRTQEEFEDGHIQGALLLPYDTITAETAEELLSDKTKTILVYCRTGRRSEIAAKALIELGYTSVYDFGGITSDWNGKVVK